FGFTHPAMEKKEGPSGIYPMKEEIISPLSEVHPEKEKVSQHTEVPEKRGFRHLHLKGNFVMDFLSNYTSHIGKISETNAGGGIEISYDPIPYFGVIALFNGSGGDVDIMKGGGGIEGKYRFFNFFTPKAGVKMGWLGIFSNGELNWSYFFLSPFAGIDVDITEYIGAGISFNYNFLPFGSGYTEDIDFKGITSLHIGAILSFL
ncbi:MAG: hypothetical protein QXI58_08280, partial [Candidatus Micrarchaeia archaeon]